MKSLIFDDILSRGRNISTEIYPIPGSFKAFEPQTPVCYCKRKGMSHDHDQTGCWEWSCELNKNHVVFFEGGRADS